MADFGKFFQSVSLKAQEAIGNAASNIAANTKTKVNEINLSGRRSEIMNSFAEKAYAIWKSGEAFPAELDALLKEVSELDTQLEQIKSERIAAAKAKEEAAAKARAEAEEKKKEQRKAPSLVVPEQKVENAAEEAVTAAEETVEEAVAAAEETAEAAVEDASDALEEAAEAAAAEVEEVCYTAAETVEEAVKEVAEAVEAAFEPAVDEEKTEEA